jgi:hypothetical protein
MYRVGCEGDPDEEAVAPAACASTMSIAADSRRMNPGLPEPFSI